MLEISAVITTILCVFLLYLKKTVGWLFGIFGAALFFLLFLQKDLYFQSGLQIIYIAQSAYGWWVWNKEDILKPKMIDNWYFFTHILLVIGLSFLMIFITDLNTGIDGFLDVLTTLLALLATYYLSKKIIQSWYLWTLINILLMGLFVLQGLWVASGMEIILLTISVNASINWTKEFKNEK